ncbi:unnamed protein product [Rhizophagus irregularis]|uniref:Uncharacterized protein n=2 Tax=Rhizophagus irregularis TaxID=588596 RepID=A0A915YV54_9GLOM|nr:hypothetical protein GLOIN_2v1874633 [Rhizophagus irregularis DAOM 181602=DAOM 197198]POG73108.1 hypothetical protein GLOIN_2v1874633 [Rhizophagus irregularis DAOM 181602=DAOM 197198]CAB5195390.1 unnamed protein product [Rhizophagus irregularis]CAB5342937.1 unnamed protein product [Rhizophagus irregularis]|eukprot:XP_025179974.1 hypothetical protein GLOIN_2v1874633 [Rhizophagus irregularis DAOM 181602=DAOM 197198]
MPLPKQGSLSISPSIIEVYHKVSSIFADGYNYDGGLSSWNVNPKCGGQISKQSKPRISEQLGEREIRPVQDFEQLRKLMVARKAFLNKLKDEGMDLLAFISPGIVDDKPAIIVVFPDETLQICLPANV